MADFKTWDRGNLEWFAHEAMAKLIENNRKLEEIKVAVRKTFGKQPVSDGGVILANAKYYNELVDILEAKG